MMRPREFEREPDKTHDRDPSLETQSERWIVVADDNDSTKWALQKLLETSGYDVTAVSDGSELLYQLEPLLLEDSEVRTPDLIITDVRMPGISIFAVVDQLRERGLDIPVIVVTGYGSDRVRHRVRKLGETIYFEKPVDIDRLERWIEKLTG